MKLALGPNLFYWTLEATQAFYEQVAQWPVDIVYLGETVCSRRHDVRAKDYLAIAQQLADAGKEVVLSSQILIEAETDLLALRKLCNNGRFMVEANEMGAARLMSEKQLPWVAGPSLNIFNPHTLAVMAKMGAKRWVMPPESGRDLLASILAECPQGMATEVFAYGQLPLAMSARCFTARRYNRQKDTCEFKCQDFPSGMPVTTADGETFLVINGVQTLSFKKHNLLGEAAALKAMGVGVLRLSPQAEGMAEVVLQARAALDGQPITPHPDECNGFWHRTAGRELLEALS